MNADMFFSILQDTDGSYLDSAAKSMRIKKAPINRKIQLRPILIAATFILLFTIMIPVGIMMANREKPITPPPTTTTAVVTVDPLSVITPTFVQDTALSDITGAVLTNDAENFVFESDKWMPGFILDRQKWIANIKENYAVVLGKVIQYSAVKIEEEENSYYYVMTMTVSVVEALCNIEKQDTMDIVYVAHYTPTSRGDRLDTPYYFYDGVSTNKRMGDLAVFATNAIPPYSAALLLLSPVDNDTLTIGNETYSLSNYGSHRLAASLMSDLRHDDSGLGLPYARLWHFEIRESGETVIRYPSKKEE